MAFPGIPPGGAQQSGGQHPGGIKPGPLQSVSGMDLLLLLIIWLGVQRLLPTLFLSAPEAGSQSDGVSAQPPIITALLLIALHSLTVLGAIYFFIVRKYGLRLADIGIVLVSGKWVLRAAIFGVLVIPASGIIIQFVQSLSREALENPQQEIFVAGGYSPAILITSLLVTGAIVPLVEEIAFRGVFYGWLRARLPLAASVAISSAVFALLHGILFLIPVFALIGAVLALITEKSGSVLAATITHGVFNAINILSFYWLMQQGLLPPASG